MTRLEKKNKKPCKTNHKNSQKIHGGRELNSASPGEKTNGGPYPIWDTYGHFSLFKLLSITFLKKKLKFFWNNRVRDLDEIFLPVSGFMGVRLLCQKLHTSECKKTLKICQKLKIWRIFAIFSLAESFSATIQKKSSWTISDENYVHFSLYFDFAVGWIAHPTNFFFFFSTSLCLGGKEPYLR